MNDPAKYAESEDEKKAYESFVSKYGVTNADQAKAQEKALPSLGRQMTFSRVKEVKLPDDQLPSFAEHPEAWIPIINGMRIINVIYEIDEPIAGCRADQVPNLMFHFPGLRAFGYELTQFTLHLMAYDQKSLDELNTLRNSIYPPVRPKNQRAQLPKICTIEWPGLSIMGLRDFIPIKPSTSGVWSDTKTKTNKCNFTFLQYQPIPIYAGHRVGSVLGADVGEMSKTGNFGINGERARIEGDG
jgi:hypothetical protein